jgi:hypothetical protein
MVKEVPILSQSFSLNLFLTLLLDKYAVHSEIELCELSVHARKEVLRYYNNNICKYPHNEILFSLL